MSKNTFFTEHLWVTVSGSFCDSNLKKRLALNFACHMTKMFFKKRWNSRYHSVCENNWLSKNFKVDFQHFVECSVQFNSIPYYF